MQKIEKKTHHRDIVIPQQMLSALFEEHATMTTWIGYFPRFIQVQDTEIRGALEGGGGVREKNSRCVA